MIETWLPSHHVRRRHAVRIAAPIDAVWAALSETDLLGSRLARLLFALRGLPSRGVTLHRLREVGFVVLESRPAAGIVLGLVARPWRLDGGLRAATPDTFRGFDEPGYVRIAWSFSLSPIPAGCRLATETRVAATDRTGRRRFAVYWWLAGPFSGLVRRHMLRAVARAALQRDAVGRLKKAPRPGPQAK